MKSFPFRGGGGSGCFHVAAILQKKKETANSIRMSADDLSHPRLLLLLLLTHSANLAAVEL